MEAFELNDHPFFVGVQYHPEYLTSLVNSHPVFKGLFKAIIELIKK